MKATRWQPLRTIRLLMPVTTHCKQHHVPDGRFFDRDQSSESQIRIIDPKLAKTSHRTLENTSYSVPFDICKLTAESPAIKASLGTYSYLSLDSEGQPRREVPDVGADKHRNILVEDYLFRWKHGKCKVFENKKLKTIRRPVFR